MKKKKQGAAFVISALLFLGILFIPTDRNAYAGTWDNAYTFYSTYGSQVVFHAMTQTDGNLCYATSASNSTSGIRFRTIGWKVSVCNKQGTVLQSMYFQLGGNYMKCVNTTTKSNYKYNLYAVSLSAIKGRMNANALSALAAGDCSIVFDACIVVSINGKLQGAMNDSGITSGKVYTTYQGIVNAQNWTSATKTSLKSYFNKSVSGLFYTVSLKKGSGISTVSGAGTYCYGTYVTVKATPAAGYQFSYWSGTSTSYSSEFGFYVNGDCSWNAYAKQMTLAVTFNRNSFSGDSVKASQVFYYGKSNQSFLDRGWTKEGYYQTGWSHSANGAAAYKITDTVTSAWISKYAPSVNLYAVWKENDYTFEFDGNGADLGKVSDFSGAYSGNMVMPENAYSFSDMASTFLGWSLEASAMLPEYMESDKIKVSELAKKAGVANTNHAVITLYAVWDQAPAIDASDLYYTLSDAKEGRITEKELASHMKAVDLEDGNIPYGKNKNNSFLLTNYDPSDFLTFSKGGSVTETCAVVDSSGNRIERTITVYLVDTDACCGSQIFGKSRFISFAYFENENKSLIPESQGGLPKDSRWVTDLSYREVLRAALWKM